MKTPKGNTVTMAGPSYGTGGGVIQKFLDRHMKAYQQRKGDEQHMAWLRENDPKKYYEILEQQRKGCEWHDAADWEDMGGGCFHRKAHGLAEHEGSTKIEVNGRGFEHESLPNEVL